MCNFKTAGRAPAGPHRVMGRRRILFGSSLIDIDRADNNGSASYSTQIVSISGQWQRTQDE